MTTFLSREVRAGLEAAKKRALGRKSRLRVHAGDAIYPLLEFKETSFAVSRDTPAMRGLVDIYDGSRHLYQALVVAIQDEGDTRVFEFKRNTIAADGPAVDFIRDPDEPAGLLETH